MHGRLSRRTARFALLLLVVPLFGACMYAPMPPPAATAPPPYRVGAPDALLVSILPEPVIEREVKVRPDGRITVDLIGDVDASGRTPEEIAEDIREKISKFKRDSVVTVSVSASLSSTFTIFGQVAAPGIRVLDRETRLSEAMGMVGGTNIFASKGRIRVLRTTAGDTEILYVNLRHIQNGDQTTNYMMRDGDIVVVPPNALARIGFALQTILFPFQQILSAGGGAFMITRAF